MRLSVVIPTGGTRPSLKDAMASATEQMKPGDELLVDVNDIPYGNGARQRTMERARGDAILFQDDDDTFAPGIFDLVRAELEKEPTRMHIFKMHYIENGEDLWADQEVREGNVASQMIVVPNIPEKLGIWGDRYEGDFDFINSTCSPEKMGEPIWHEEILSLVHHPKLKDPITRLGVVISVCEGREMNLLRAINRLRALDRKPADIVVVCDGCEPPSFADLNPDIHWVQKEKHFPGNGQDNPRNVGFVALRERTFVDHVWFLDSDLIFERDILDKYAEEIDEDRILVGPYDWLPSMKTEIDHDLFNDPRWPLFRDDNHVRRNDVFAAIACFGGNIIYPVRAFEDVGGFDARLFHGRCEDGELALRAVANGVPVGFVPEARAWHVAHKVNKDQILERNRIDVPKLYAQYGGLLNSAGFILTDQDGSRFDWVCPNCLVQVNAHLSWGHSCD